MSVNTTKLERIDFKKLLATIQSDTVSNSTSTTITKSNVYRDMIKRLEVPINTFNTNIDNDVDMIAESEENDQMEQDQYEQDQKDNQQEKEQKEQMEREQKEREQKEQFEREQREKAEREGLQPGDLRLHKFEDETKKTIENTRDYLHAKNLVIGKNDTRPASHTSLERYKCSILDPLSLRCFLQWMVKDFMGGKHNCFCEIIDPLHFRFFADCDLKLKEPPTDEFILNYTRTYQQAMGQFFGRKYRVVVATVDAVKMEESDNLAYWKAGIHWIWTDVIVNIMQAKMIAFKALSLFKQQYPDSMFPPPCNSVTDQIDLAPYKALGGGLRMLGNFKTKICPSCKGSMIGCKPCKSKGYLVEGRPYLPKYVVREDGSIDHVETEKICRSYEYSLNLTYLRVPGPVRVDFRQPTGLPPILYNKQDLNELKLSGPIGRIDSKLDPANLSNGTCQVELLEEELSLVGIPPVSANEIVSKYHDVALKLPKNQIFVVFKQKETGAGSDQALKVKYGALWNVAQSDNSRAVIDLCNKGQNKLEPILYDPNLHPPIELFIRNWNPQWRDIKVSAITSNINSKSKTKFMLVFIEGSKYCCNKRADHSTAGPYFYISQYGQISQRCTSRKIEIRASGLACPTFKTEEQTLPEAICTVIKACFQDLHLLTGSENLTHADRLTMQQRRQTAIQQAYYNGETSEANFGTIAMLQDMLFLTKKNYEEKYKKPIE